MSSQRTSLSCTSCALRFPGPAQLARHEALDHTPAPDGVELTRAIIEGARHDDSPTAGTAPEPSSGRAGARPASTARTLWWEVFWLWAATSLAALLVPAAAGALFVAFAAVCVWLVRHAGHRSLHAPPAGRERRSR